MYFDALRPILDYVEYFGQTDHAGQAFFRILPSLMNEDTLNQISIPTSPSPVSIHIDRTAYSFCADDFIKD